MSQLPPGTLLRVVLKTTHEINAALISILQVEKLRHGTVHGLTKGPAAHSWWNLGLSLSCWIPELMLIHHPVAWVSPAPGPARPHPSPAPSCPP